MKQSKLFIATAILILCYALSARAQQAENVFCPDFQRTDLQGKQQHLYSYLSDNKMVFLMTGDIRQSATRDLLQSYSLQKLTEEHGPAAKARPYSTNDIQVIFVQNNADLASAGDVSTQLAALPFPVIVPAADDNLLPEDLNGVQAGIFLITPDHLAHPVHFNHAQDAYRIAARYKTAYRPTEEPDVRIIRCVAPAVAGNEITVITFFQNYSNQRLGNATVRLYAGNTLVAEKIWKGDLASLETGSISLGGKIASDAPLHITVATTGDRYTVNNSWELSETKRYTAANAASLPVATSISEEHLPAGWNTAAQQLFSPTQAGSAGQEALRIAFSKMLPSQKDTLFIGNYNLGLHPVMSFSRAYAPSSELAEAGIAIIASADEGKTWSVVKNYDNTALMTTNTQSYAYQPRNGHEWIKEHINLADIAGKNNVWLAIVATADYTNDAYISNISLFDETPTMASK